MKVAQDFLANQKVWQSNNYEITRLKTAVTAIITSSLFNTLYSITVYELTSPPYLIVFLSVQSWENWIVRKLSGRSYGSRLNEKLRSYEVQLQILEDEEARLLRLLEERQNNSVNACRNKEHTDIGFQSVGRIESD